MKNESESPLSVHVPVLLQEVISVLALHQDDVVVDGTAGGGGHATSILKHLGDQGRYIGIDADAHALKRVHARLGADPRVNLVESNFRSIDTVLHGQGLDRVDKILLDLGLSSDQLDSTDLEKSRGFSFARDEPLTMTFCSNPSPSMVTAEMVVNEWSEEALADILFGYGNERSARKIARAIVAARSQAPIRTTAELQNIVTHVIPRNGATHPATKTFQAIRMAVNDELGALEEVLEKGVALLSPGGRIAVITFHSLEDRIVKRYFREYEDASTGVRITKKPIAPSDEELATNRRARSAKLRCLEKAPL